MSSPGPRILFVNHTAGISGPTSSLLLLVRYLKDRYDVSVLVPEEGVLCGLLADEDVRHFVIPGLVAKTIPQILRLVRREAFDLVYGNNPGGCSRNAMLATKLAKRPFIWHIRGMVGQWPWRRGVFLRGADAIVAVSRAAAGPVRRFYPREVHVVYNGVELSSFEDDRASARRYFAEQLGLSPDIRLVICVSHLTPRKAHEQAIAAMAQLAKQTTGVHLVVAGSLDRDLHYTARIRALIRERGLGDRIHLLGLRTDIPRLLRGADVLIHTARREGQPRAILEAMAAEAPVVAFGVDGVAETVVDGETGYLLPWGNAAGMADAVLSLLCAPDRAAEMGRRGRKRVLSYFTAAGTARQVARIIDRVLQGGRTGDRHV